MQREEVASNKLRQIVSGFQGDGLPSPFNNAEEAQTELSSEQLGAFEAFYTALETYNGKVGEGEPQEGTPWWDAVLELRKQLQIAVEAGLIRMPLVQKLIFDYGALPDPKVDWRYHRLPSGQYACWQCGTGIIQKQVLNSVWIKGMRCAGTGEVRREMVPYCPSCDSEPRDGVIMESDAEALARDHRLVTASRRSPR